MDVHLNMVDGVVLKKNKLTGLMRSMKNLKINNQKMSLKESVLFIFLLLNLLLYIMKEKFMDLEKKELDVLVLILQLLMH